MVSPSSRWVIPAVLCLVAQATWNPFARAQEQNVLRKVTITWKSVEDAVKYEVHLSQKPEMTPLQDKKVFQGVSGAFQLAPGTYYFRVRGLDDDNSLGPWSAVQGFIVNPGPPKMLEPENRQIFKDELPASGITFNWSKGYSGTEYKIEIQDKHGAILNRNVNGTTFNWKPDLPGVYKWRVGFETAGGAEWSAFRVFQVTKKAVGFSASQQRMFEKLKEVGELPLIDREEKGGFSAILRGAQSIALQKAYKGFNTFNKTSGSVLGALSAELRWRLKREKGQAWGFSGSFNFEMLRQRFGDNDYVEPRIYLRVFATKVGRSLWRHGPFFHFQIAKSGIPLFDSDGTTEEVNERVSIGRMQPGLGYVGVYQASKSMYFSGLFLLRYDLGGSSDSFFGTGKADGNLGFEAGFGVVINLSDKFFAEGRVRAQLEKTSWADTSGTSFYQGTYVIGDAGIGYNF